MSTKLDIRCAYCTTLITTSLGIVRVPTRAACVGIATCPTCDSKFSIHISTKRKSKGKRLKAIESQRAAEQQARIAQADAENDRIALELLAEPGCDCGEHKPDRSHHYYAASRRPDGLERGGTGQGGMPLAPRHRYDCPANPNRK